MTGIHKGQVGIFHAVREAIAISVGIERVGSGLGTAHVNTAAVLDSVEESVAVTVIILGIGSQVPFLGVGQAITVGIAEGSVGAILGPGRGFPGGSIVIWIKAVGEFVGIRKAIVVAIPGSAGRHDKVIDEEVLVGSTHAG